MLAFFIYFAPVFPTKFWFIWPLGSGEVQNGFSRWRPWRSSWIFIRNCFSLFLCTSRPKTSYEIYGQSAFWFRMFKIYFQDGGHGWHFGFRIGMILAILDQLVTPMPQSKFRFLFNGSGGVIKMRKADWRRTKSDSISWPGASFAPGKLNIISST